MKYKATRSFSMKDIINHSSYKCDAAIDIGVKEFGYSKAIQWNEETENFVINKIEGGIDWLIMYGFIKWIEKEFVFNRDKVYIFEGCGLYKLHRQGLDTDKYSFDSLNNSNFKANGVGGIENVIEAAKEYGKVYECDSVEEYFKGNKKEI